LRINQFPLIFASLVARTSGPPMNVSNDVRKAGAPRG
jgi:hypothetical protein